MKRKITAALASLVATASVVLGIASPAMAVTTYYYAGANQTITNTGAYANITVAAPAVNSPTDVHSLTEVAIQDAAGNALEVGWRVAPSVYGDSNAHLFFAWWDSGVFKCYDTACAGYVDYASNATNVGATLTPTGTGAKKFGIEYSASASPAGWWVWYDTNWIGYFPTSAFTAGTMKTGPTASLVQMFGEVANTNGTNPISDMGDGTLATSTAGAVIGSVTMPGIANGSINMAIFAANPTKYNAVSLSGRTFRYGGPGW